jgi:hypothetical protein
MTATEFTERFDSILDRLEKETETPILDTYGNPAKWHEDYIEAKAKAVKTFWDSMDGLISLGEIGPRDIQADPIAVFTALNRDFDRLKPIVRMIKLFESSPSPSHLAKMEEFLGIVDSVYTLAKREVEQ